MLVTIFLYRVSVAEDSARSASVRSSQARAGSSRPRNVIELRGAREQRQERIKIVDRDVVATFR
jgi:hypothetical protein